MSSEPTSNVSSSSPASSTGAVDPAVKSPTKSAEGEFDPKATYSSMGDFQAHAPKKVVDSFMQSIAEGIIRDMKRGSERLKKAMRKIREN